MYTYEKKTNYSIIGEFSLVRIHPIGKRIRRDRCRASMTTNEPIRHYQYHSMATSGTSQAANTGRPLPKVRSPNPPGASSDETPRTVTGDGSARQRRRAQNQTTREKTPSGRETVSPSPAKEVIILILSIVLLMKCFV